MGLLLITNGRQRAARMSKAERETGRREGNGFGMPSPKRHVAYPRSGILVFLCPFWTSAAFLSSFNSRHALQPSVRFGPRGLFPARRYFFSVFCSSPSSSSSSFSPTLIPFPPHSIVHPPCPTTAPTTATAATRRTRPS